MHTILAFQESTCDIGTQHQEPLPSRSGRDGPQPPSLDILLLLFLFIIVIITFSFFHFAVVGWV